MIRVASRAINVSIDRMKLGLSAFFLLAACTRMTESPPTLPVLSVSELTGCWYRVMPSLPREVCYTSNMKAYIISISDSDSGLFVEDTGSFVVVGKNTIEARLFSHSSDNKTGSLNYQEFMYIRNDTLYGASVFVRSDAARNCLPHWRLMQKPADWN